MYKYKTRQLENKIKSDKCKIFKNFEHKMGQSVKRICLNYFKIYWVLYLQIGFTQPKCFELTAQMSHLVPVLFTDGAQ